MAQIAGEEGLGALGFFADGVNVSVEGQFGVNMNTQIFGRVGDLQDMAMDRI